MFELQTLRPVPGFEELGDVELRELPYGAVRAALAAGASIDRSTEALFAASLHIDGKPVGLEGLDALPGRVSGSVSAAVARCMELHGLGRRPPAEPDADADADETPPSASAEAPPTGEA